MIIIIMEIQQSVEYCISNKELIIFTYKHLCLYVIYLTKAKLIAANFSFHATCWFDV